MVLLLPQPTPAQSARFPRPPAETPTANSSMDLVRSTLPDNNLWRINGQQLSPLKEGSGTVSRLDQLAPNTAKQEFEKGNRLLFKKKIEAAIVHFKAATLIDPNFVAAHNALGSMYLALGKNQEALEEFARANSLDDHLPNSYLNLGCANLAMDRFAEAERWIGKAAAIAPIDMDLQTALAYGQLMNRDFAAVIETARRLHSRGHPGAAIVHLYAAAAWEAQNQVPQAEDELGTLLLEDPQSRAIEQAHQMMARLKEKDKPLSTDTPASAQGISSALSNPANSGTPPGQASAPIPAPDSTEKPQIAEALCPACESADSAVLPGHSASTDLPASSPTRSAARSKEPADSGFLIRSSVDEVSAFFAATDHGKAVTTLTRADIRILDAHMPPKTLTGFRNQSQLPLRLGFAIDTSSSISGRFHFEQEASAAFLQSVLTEKSDLAFVVGFANSVLLVQDFTADQKLISHAIDELAPSGGTALWDAVSFAVEKLASSPEIQPVARILVVLSDGEDNSSSSNLKRAIDLAQQSGVIVYAVSTRDVSNDDKSMDGEKALTTLTDLTGGATFRQGVVHTLDDTFSDLHWVIRSRYMVSYTPAQFKRNGQYRPIEISAAKDGHKLRVYARKGYFASVIAPSSTF